MMPKARCSQVVGIRRPINPASNPPGIAPNRYGQASDQGREPEQLTQRETMQMGRMMTIEEENTSCSSSSEPAQRRGTNTMPPPAPSRPLTAPAAKPANRENNFLCIKIASCTVSAQEAVLIQLNYMPVLALMTKSLLTNLVFFSVTEIASIRALFHASISAVSFSLVTM